ncbi:MAG: hypothetical protein ACPG47_04320 [Leucothrix sp.]
MKLITLILVIAIAPVTNAATKPVKAKDLNRVSVTCEKAETKSLKKKCKKIIKKDLNRVKHKLKNKQKLINPV